MIAGPLWPHGPVRVVARNAGSGRVVADCVGIAATRVSRAIGLLSRKRLDPGEALWIVPSNGIHTCGMRFPIDVLALDSRGIVIDRLTHLAPWRMRLPKRGVVGVLELAAGAVEESGTMLGDRVLFEIVDAVDYVPVASGLTRMFDVRDQECA